MPHHVDGAFLRALPDSELPRVRTESWLRPPDPISYSRPSRAGRHRYAIKFVLVRFSVKARKVILFASRGRGQRIPTGALHAFKAPRSDPKEF